MEAIVTSAAQAAKISAHSFNTLIAAALAEEWSSEPGHIALSEILETAPRGQNGAVFITRRAEAVASDNHRTCLWINRRLRAQRNSWGKVVVFTAEEAEKNFQETKSMARASRQRYETQLETLGRLLWKWGLYEFPSGNFHIGVPGWEYMEGQKGGCFRPTNGATFSVASEKEEGYRGLSCSPPIPWVSAPGAFKRAGKILQKEGPYRG